ncbi:MAG: hypothetical protein NVS3B7_03800 [Candidatus Elarobacter sp.]
MTHDHQVAPGLPEPPYDVPRLRRFEGVEVRVRLADGLTWTGWLRTDLLTDRSLSVYVRCQGGDGATLYIDQIAEVFPVA